MRRRVRTRTPLIAAWALGTSGALLAAGCEAVLGLGDLHDRDADAATSMDGTTGDGEVDAPSTSDGTSDATVDATGDVASDGPSADGSPEGGLRTPPSCMPRDGGSGSPTSGAGMTNCGPGGSGTESCCTSLKVTGGTFLRGYDGVYNDAGYAATVSDFTLDKYEVTVGRFRQFVNAVVVDKWSPAPGSGRHSYLNDGGGLNMGGTGTESGWDTSWTANLPTDANGWNVILTVCNASQTHPTWSAMAGGNENLPITCVDWFEAYAFCIWDGGFLPSEAEWNYAAAGGDQQRVYPWSEPVDAGAPPTIGCGYANYLTCFGGANAVGSESPKGDGRWGQSDLGGNAWEWVLDWRQDPYTVPCDNCANLGAGATRIIRSGGFGNDYTACQASDRFDEAPNYHGAADVGFRCARAP
jgi:formylglycine-generating enzyme required for sulfatase activity